MLAEIPCRLAAGRHDIASAILRRRPGPRPGGIGLVTPPAASCHVPAATPGQPGPAAGRGGRGDQARAMTCRMAETPTRAGVGVGTMYRTSRRASTSAALTAGLRPRAPARPRGRRVGRPAVDSVGKFFAATIEHRDQLVLPLHGGPTRPRDQAGRSRPRSGRCWATLLRRSAGRQLRADVTPGDIIITAAQFAQPLATIGDGITGPAARPASTSPGCGRPGREAQRPGTGPYLSSAVRVLRLAGPAGNRISPRRGLRFS